jgi:hypothetical protein
MQRYLNYILKNTIKVEQEETLDGRHSRNQRAYTTWEQVAGYFDGDGSLKVHTGVYALPIGVSWTDQDSEQIEHVKEFLAREGVIGRMGETRQRGQTYYELHVAQSGKALVALKRMLALVDKKESQVRAGIDYLENRITGEQFTEKLNEAVRLGKRSSPIRNLKMPYTKEEGVRLARANARLGKGRALTAGQIRAMKEDRDSLGLTFRELSNIYGVAPSTAQRSLAKYL